MRSPRIEAIPKRVELVRLADGRFASKPDIDLERFLENLLDIRDHILRGRPLPEYYYRRSTGRDYLLERRGWLHLQSVTISMTTCC